MAKEKEVKVEMVNSALATLVGQRRVAYCESVNEGMDMAYECSEALQLAPFNLTDCSLVDIHIPVLSVMLLGRNAKPYIRIIKERPNFTSLFVDSHLRGKDALFIVRTFHGAKAGDAQQYIQRLSRVGAGDTSPGIIIGKSVEGIIPVAFQLKQLF
jgi:hypothetical protein